MLMVNNDQRGRGSSSEKTIKTKLASRVISYTFSICGPKGVIVS